MASTYFQGGPAWDIPLGLKYKEPTSNINSAPNLPAGGSLGNLAAQLGASVPSIEQSKLSQTALDFLKNKTGYNFTISPFSDSNSNAPAAYFSPKALFGGLSDPTDRRLFFNKAQTGDTAPGLGTLFHEASHAVDPNLLFTNDLNKFDPRLMQQAFDKNRVNALEYAYQTGIPARGGGEPMGRPSMIGETEGQRGAGQFLTEFAQEHPELNINPKAYTENLNYKSYPMSYASGTLDSFYAPWMQNQPISPDSMLGDNTTLQMKGANLYPNMLLQDALDPAMQKEQQSIRQRAADYVNSKLNQYQ